MQLVVKVQASLQLRRMPLLHLFHCLALRGLMVQVMQTRVLTRTFPILASLMYPCLDPSLAPPVTQ